jgi:ribonucleoside-diphosphate reductase beta chain
MSSHWQRYQKAKKLTWDPRDVDLEQDRRDWAAMSHDERSGALRACRMFLGGEEAVASDLAPLLIALRKRDAGQDRQFFLVSQLWDEARHAELFARWIEEVAGGDDDSGHGDAHRQLFEEVLPQTLDALLTDDSDEALVRAVTTYHVIIEGTLAETGYNGFYRSRKDNDVLPGLVQGIELVQRDEARHVAFGIDLLRETFVSSPEARAVMDETAAGQFPLVMGILGDYFEPYGDVNPFGLTMESMLEFAQSQFMKRYAALT